MVRTSKTTTVKLVIFMCPCEFRDLGDFAKTTGHKYSKSAILSVLLRSASKNVKIKVAKIISIIFIHYALIK